MANRLSRDRIEELWAVYQERESIEEVSKRCGVHRKTAERYRASERWDERLAAVRKNAAAHLDLSLSHALAENIQIVRDYKRHLVSALAKKQLDPSEVTATEIEKILKLETFLLGGADARLEVSEKFSGWSDEDLERYATSGKLPQR